MERVSAEKVIDLRHLVLRARLSRDTAIFPGDTDPQTVHIAALDRGKVVGCATVQVNPWNGQRAGQLRGMAVDPGYQGRGIGRMLLAEIERIAAEKCVEILWANARSPAADFYRKHGWEIASTEFEIPTAGPHFKMIRRLGRAEVSG